MSLRPLETRYAGCRFRSRTEARWAVFFDAAGLRFQYEPEGFSIRSGCYLPDFYLPDVRLFFEVKGAEPTDEERRKCAELCEQAECELLLAVGNPEERFNLIWFDRAGERPERYVLARDRYSACGFWLIADEVENWIGPDRSDPPQLPRGPMLSGALEQAYAVARSARFERGDGQTRQPKIHEADPERRISERAA